MIAIGEWLKYTRNEQLANGFAIHLLLRLFARLLPMVLLHIDVKHIFEQLLLPYLTRRVFRHAAIIVAHYFIIILKKQPFVVQIKLSLENVLVVVMH